VAKYHNAASHTRLYLPASHGLYDGRGGRAGGGDFPILYSLLYSVILLLLFIYSIPTLMPTAATAADAGFAQTNAAGGRVRRLPTGSCVPRI